MTYRPKSTGRFSWLICQGTQSGVKSAVLFKNLDKIGSVPDLGTCGDLVGAKGNYKIS